ncbi:MAG TPA: type VI secretion system-associated FHA domain protein TagH [Lichenihabitans sp.]|jgi:type VI secretion system protein ImpI|nr:type VI secretion system-associated FHA domain protein TagH [Lichenihabitans sp.]
MVLRLRIENLSTLPDGGPLAIDVPGRRGIDIGRDQHLDWTLPDPTRFISGKHCEIRFGDGGYWLRDVSSNGTFLNGAEDRMGAPHRLRTGDRVEIGDYIIAVTVDLGDIGDAPAPPAARPARGADLWQVDEDVAPPAAAEPRRPASDAVLSDRDFLDHLVDSSGPDGDALWNGMAPSRPRDAAPPSAAPQGFDWSREAGGGRVSPMAPSKPSRPETGRAEPPEARPDPPSREIVRSRPAAEATGSSVAGGDDALSDFRRRLAHGAGVPEAVFASQPAGDLAEDLGRLLRLTTENVQHLLQSRSELKDIVRSSSHTMIMAADNNPLKFTPSVEEALRIMFAPASGSYLGARAALEQGFRDLKLHQVQTYSAMQLAIGMLVKDLDPKQIEAETEPDRGLGAMMGSRKARLWDVFVERWRAKVARHDDGLLGAFLLYFSECYDRASRHGR